MDVVSAYLLRFGITINPMKFNHFCKSFLFLHFFRSLSPSKIVSSLLQKLKLMLILDA
jgi:hypothetical protein